MKQTIYVIHFKSTGETWHFCVCADRNSVAHVLNGHSLTQQVYGADDGDFQEWTNPNDLSQTATVMRQFLVNW